MILNKTIEITVADGVDGSVDLTDVCPLYVVRGNPTLTQNWALAASGSVQNGMTCVFLWKAQPDFNGNTVTVFGVTIPESLSEKEFYLIATYYDSGWQLTCIADLIQAGGGTGLEGANVGLADYITNVMIKSDAAIHYDKIDLDSSVDNDDLAAEADIEFSKMEALTATKIPIINGDGEIEASAVDSGKVVHLTNVTSDIQTQISGKVGASLSRGSVLVGNGSSEAAPVDFKTAGQIPVGDGTDLNSVAITGDIRVAADGEATLDSDAVTPSKGSEDMRTSPMVVDVSFETNYLGNYKFEVPWKANLTRIFVSVIKTIEASNDATLNFKDNSSQNMTGGSLSSGNLTVSAGSANGATVSSVVTGNNSFNAEEILTIASSKSTAGGTVKIVLTFEKQD